MLTFIRANRQRDWPILQQIDKEFYPKDWWNREDFLEKGLIIYMVFNRGRIIGWVGFWLNMEFSVKKNDTVYHQECFYLGGLSLRSRFFREEIVKQIMAFVLEYAESHGMTEASTNERESHPLLPVLEKCGFCEVGRTTDYWEDPPEPNVVLQVRL